MQIGKLVGIPQTNVFNNAAGTNGVWASQSLSTFVPPIASVAIGLLGGPALARSAVAADANGTGEQIFVSAVIGTTFEGYVGGGSYRVLMLTAQTIYHKEQTNDANYRLDVTGWEYP